MIPIIHNKLRIPSGERLTSWLFTQHEDKSIEWQEEDLNPVSPDNKSSTLTTRPRHPLNDFNINVI